MEDEIIKLPIPEKEGYTFDYWEDSRYEGGADYKITENHNFKAIWKLNSTNGAAPKTGDNQQVLFYSSMLIVSLFGIYSVVQGFKLKKRYENII